MLRAISLISMSNAWRVIVVICGILIVPIKPWPHSEGGDWSRFATRPGQPNEISVQFISINLQELEASWCTDQPDVNYSLSYTTEYFVFRNRSDLMLTSPVLKDSRSDIAGKTCWKSVWRNGNNVFYVRIYGSNNATSNRLVFTTSSGTLPRVDPLKHLKPAAVRLLNHSAPTQSSVNISWCRPQGVVYDDEEVQLNYMVNCSSKWDNRSIEIHGSTTVQLVSLLAGTQYAISVACKPMDSGYWSEPALLQIKTVESAPSVAPVIEPDFFYFETFYNEPYCYATIFWKPVPERDRNGNIFYELIVVNSHNVSVYKTNTTSTFARLKLNLTMKHAIHLRGFTSAGYSPLARIDIPKFDVIDPLTTERVTSSPFFAESSRNHGVVTVVWNSSAYLPTAVFYCFTEKYNHETINEHYPCDKRDISSQAASGQNTNQMTLKNARLDDQMVLWYTLSGGADIDHRGNSGLLGPWSSCVFDYTPESMPSEPKILLDVRRDIPSSNKTILLLVDRLNCTEQPLVRVARYILKIFCPRYENLYEKNLSVDTTNYELTEFLKDQDMNFTITLTAVSFHGRHGPDAVTFYYNRGGEAESQILIGSLAPAFVACPIIVIIFVIVLICFRKCSGRVENCFKHSIDIKPPVMRTEFVEISQSPSSDHPENVCIPLLGNEISPYSLGAPGQQRTTEASEMSDNRNHWTSGSLMSDNERSENRSGGSSGNHPSSATPSDEDYVDKANVILKKWPHLPPLLPQLPNLINVDDSQDLLPPPNELDRSDSSDQPTSDSPNSDDERSGNIRDRPTETESESSCCSYSHAIVIVKSASEVPQGGPSQPRLSDWNNNED